MMMPQQPSGAATIPVRGRRLRVIVVEDQPLVRQHLAETVAGFDQVEVVATCANGFDAIDHISSLTPDLVLLDVEMPGLSGFDVIEAIGPAHMPAVVFVSAYEDYALQAFMVEALDYVLKPTSTERLREAIRRARVRLSSSVRGDAHAVLASPSVVARRRRFVIRTDNQILFLPHDQVSWLEAAGNYAVVHTRQERHVIREPLRSLAQRLGAGFLRVHRGAIVNLSHVRALESAGKGAYDVVLTDSHRLRVTRRHLAALHTALRDLP